MALDQITQRLWIGNKDDGIRICEQIEGVPTPFLNIGLDYCKVGILNVAEDISEYPHRRNILYIHAGLVDPPPDQPPPWGNGNTRNEYLNAIHSLEFLYIHKETVLVHCWEGLSRSAFVLTTFISWYSDIDFDQAEKYIHDRHEIRIHPIHMNMLKELQLTLHPKPWESTGLKIDLT